MEENQNKEPWLAAILSLFFPGIGQIYANYEIKGTFFILTQLFILLTAFILFTVTTGLILIVYILFLSLILIQIINIFDAYYTAKKNNDEEFEQERKENKDYWLAIFLTIIFPGIGHLYLKKVYTGLIFIFIGILTLTLKDFTGINHLDTIFYLITQITAVCHIYISLYKQQNRKRTDQLIYFVVFFILSIFYTQFPKVFFKVFYFPTGSMEDTIVVGDHILSTRVFNYKPKINDLIIFKKPGDETIYLKRCVAVPGDTFQIKIGSIIRNGKKVIEPFAKGETNYDDFPEKIIEGKVPENHIVVLGDNRENSYDSRGFGYLNIKEVEYKFIGIYWNTNDIKSGNFDRLGAVK